MIVNFIDLKLIFDKLVKNIKYKNAMEKSKGKVTQQKTRKLNQSIIRNQRD